MKILILGGTQFLGRHLAQAALSRNHNLTLFNRGKTNPDLFPQANKLIGDRESGLDALKNGTWDAVIDTCGYVPRLVRASAELLAPRVGQYTFISSVSAYAEFSQKNIDEQAPVGRMTDETVEEVDGDTYGPLKVLCEEAVENIYPARSLNIRPGLIVGPHDPTDRFSYWPYRVQAGGEILCPQNFVTQIIDGRDLAEWTIRLLENGETGIFNATGPDYELSFDSLLETCRHFSRTPPIFTPVNNEFLQQNEVAPWSDLPLFISGSEEYAGFSHINVNKAIEAGLTFRPLKNTVQDTLDWLATRDDVHEWRAGISREREEELLIIWHQNQ